MPFDVEGARRAGYSEEEIGQYLESKSNPSVPKFDVTAKDFDVEGALKAGYTEEEIAQHLQTKSKSKVQTPTTAQTVPTTQPPQPTFMDKWQNIVGGADDVQVGRIPQWAVNNPNLAGSLYLAHKTLSPIAEALGLVGGGILGAGAGPVGAPIGAGLGYAGAREISQFGAENLGISPPSTFTQAATRTGGNILEGAANEMGGQIVGKGLDWGLKKVLSPMAGRMTPEARQTAKLAEREGVPLTAAETTGSRTLSLLERGLNFIPGSSEIMQKEGLGQLEALTKMRERLIQQAADGKPVQESVEKVGLDIKNIIDNYLRKNENWTQKDVMDIGNRFLKKAGSTDTYDSLGMKTQELLAKKSKEASTKASELYSKVGELIPKESEVPLTNLQQTASSLLEREMAKPASMQDKGVISILRDLAGSEEKAINAIAEREGPHILTMMEKDPQLKAELLKDAGFSGGRPWESVQAMRSDLGQRIAQSDMAYKTQQQGNQKLLSGSDSGVYKQLRSSLQKDMDAFMDTSASPEAKDAYTVANAFYKDIKQTFNKPDVLRLMKSNPDRVLDMVIRPGRVDEIKELKKAIGNKGFEPLSQRFVTKLFDDAAKGEKFTFEKVAKQIEKYGEDTMVEVMGKDNYRKLITTIGKGLNREALPLADPFMTGIIKKSAPESVMNMIFHPNNSRNIGLIRRVIGQDKFNEAKAKFVEKILTVDPKFDVYQPLASVKAITKMDNPTLRSIFSKSELSGLDDMVRLSKAAQTSERMAGNPSGTAQSMITWETGRAILKHPVMGWKYVLTPAALAKVYLSPTGRKYLTEGFKTPPNAGTAASLATRILSIAGNKAERYDNEETK